MSALITTGLFKRSFQIIGCIVKNILVAFSRFRCPPHAAQVHIRCKRKKKVPQWQPHHLLRSYWYHLDYIFFSHLWIITSKAIASDCESYKHDYKTFASTSVVIITMIPITRGVGSNWKCMYKDVEDDSFLIRSGFGLTNVVRRWETDNY